MEKHENLKSRRTRFTKIGKQALLYLLFISEEPSKSLRREVFTKLQKIKENSTEKLVKNLL